MRSTRNPEALFLCHVRPLLFVVKHIPNILDIAQYFLGVIEELCARLKERQYKKVCLFVSEMRTIGTGKRARWER